MRPPRAGVFWKGGRFGLEEAPDALEEPIWTFLGDEVSAVGYELEEHVVGVVAVAERDSSRQGVLLSVEMQRRDALAQQSVMAGIVRDFVEENVAVEAMDRVCRDGSADGPQIGIEFFV